MVKGLVVELALLEPDAATSRSATVGTFWMSPRTSKFVSRLGEYRMPPGARMLLLVIELTTSVSVRPDELSLFGSTLT